MSDNHSSTEDHHLEAHESALRRCVRDAISHDLRESPAPSMDELIQRGTHQHRSDPPQLRSAHVMRWGLVSLVMISWMMTRSPWSSHTTNKGELSSIHHAHDHTDSSYDEDDDSEDHLDLSGPLDFLLDEEFEVEGWVAINATPVPLDR